MLEGADDASLDAAIAKISELVGFMVDEEPLRKYELGIDQSEYGRIIGQRGSTLRKIEQEAGCVVSIPGPRTPGLEHVTLEGREAACEKGKSLIEEAVGRACAVLGQEDSAEGGMLAPSPKVNYLQRQDTNNAVGIHEVLFFPDDSEEHDRFGRFLDYIRSAKRSVKVAVFTVSDSSTATVLIKLLEAGVDVMMITEDSTVHNSGSQVERLMQAGVNVRVDNTPYLMHHKFAVLDSECVLTGSFNWTREAATHNAENVLFTNNQDFVHQFEPEFDKLWETALPLTPAKLEELKDQDFTEAIQRASMTHQ
jgi:phosphatidylserine/phosphatidylglycerophosphate/cardiolipin synthase-like enzyme